MLCVDTEQFQEVDPAYLYCSRVPGFQGLGFRVQGFLLLQILGFRVFGFEVPVSEITNSCFPSTITYRSSVRNKGT